MNKHDKIFKIIPSNFKTDFDILIDDVTVFKS